LKEPRYNIPPNAPKTSLLEHFQEIPFSKKLLYDKNIEFSCKKGGGWESMNTSYYLPKK
jgi:hypothetical protein